MSIFTVHQRVLQDYQDFIHSFVVASDPRIQEEIRRLLLDEQHLWPEPLIQLSPAYRRDATVDELAAEGILHPTTAQVFRRADGQSIRLYTHQVQAIRAIHAGRSVVVTSGTGSGKSYCYFIPIVDTAVRFPEEPGPIAIVVYPMNALVNSQHQALSELKRHYEARTGQPFPLRFARYTGETPNEEREHLRREPPHLLLTNYVMAELLLDRPEDEPFIHPRPDARAPFFLVFDELHTYRGRQGADVALLARRLRARLERPQVIHVGTSATLVAHRNATAAERREVVADFASRFFGHPFTPADIIEETLVPATEGGLPTPSELAAALEGPLPTEREALRRHPLSRWLEYALGVSPEPDGSLRRRIPRSLAAVAAELAELTGYPPTTCAERLRQVLEAASQPFPPDGQPLFALKLHQFIAQSHALFATLEPANSRSFSTELHVGGERPFFPLCFCRVCGQEYYRVAIRNDCVVPYPPATQLDDGEAVLGYLALAEAVPTWSNADLPDEWRDADGRLRPTWRDRAPVPVWIFPDGRLVEGEVDGAQAAWLQRERFWICQSCGTWYGRRESEYQKLSYLASEGRSSATTVLAVSLLRHARFLGGRDKLLTFTDSRQDASLQAGHFNDFVHVAVLRSALYAALKEHGTLHFDTVATETVKQMGLELADIARERQLNPKSLQAHQVWETFYELTEYRLYEDLYRGWRVALPNLEDVGLLHIDYVGLEELTEDDTEWADTPLATISPERRCQLLRVLLDYLRRQLAIATPLLNDEAAQRRLRKQAIELLNEFWGLDPSQASLRRATRFIWPAPTNDDEGARSLSPRTALGRFFCRELNLGAKAYESAMPQILQRLASYGLLRDTPIADNTGKKVAYQLQPSALCWKCGDGTPMLDPLAQPQPSSAERRSNRFFRQFYQDAARELGALEAREHTAQVVASGERVRRERRFRWAEEDRTDPTLGRRLPYLVCSPTMELGVDIADLDFVHLRNVPPTPANYAQRSGRAGRQGQPGLILTFCGAWNQHDQYFFRHRDEMVAGAVRAPRIDLANEALLQSHVLAEWLSESGLALHESIETVIDTEHRPELPLRELIRAHLVLSPAQRERLLRRLDRIFGSSDKELLGQHGWFNQRWLEQLVEEAPQHFDRAFDRWRELFRAATEQLDEAHKRLSVARGRTEQDEARRLQDEALRQRNLLLQQNVAREESDFYPYRYLATEGFLPGYNFPALPVRAWVPRGDGEYIARPRFLAVTEFAPGNVVYHEGSKWRFSRFIAPTGELQSRVVTRKRCLRCESFAEPTDDLCPGCGQELSGAAFELLSFLEMPNVCLERDERITCNEEERQLRSYVRKIAYRTAPHGPDSPIEADVLVDGQPLLRLRYAPSATLLTLNMGWRARGAFGFQIDLASGEVKMDDEKFTQFSRSPATTSNWQRLALGVQETRNLLFVFLLDPELRRDAKLRASLRAALQRGIGATFQLEERELGVVEVGQDEYHALLFIEETEGGLGVLRRILEDSDALAEVAREALRLCHFAPETEKPTCTSACAECLLSYTNARDFALLDRFAVRPLLEQLVRAETRLRVGSRDAAAHYAWLQTRCESSLERQFLDILWQHRLRLPDDAQRLIETPRCRADFFYQPNVLVFLDGPVHDQPDQRHLDERTRRILLAAGYRVVVLRYDQDLLAQMQAYPDIFGTA